jgi:F-type H+-transporting ATPase subunit epsilon
VWSGDATIVITRTADGDIGVLSDHAPLLSVLVEGTVEIRTPDGDYLVASVSGGFLSVANNRVSVLAESAEMSDEIDLEAARAELERAQGSDEEDDGAAVRAAEARIRAVEKAR